MAKAKKSQTEEPAPVIPDAESKLRNIRAQNEVAKAKRLVWEAAKEEASDAKKDFDAAVEILQKLIDDSPQGELFAEVAKEIDPVEAATR
jgi:hypothetical protein